MTPGRPSKKQSVRKKSKARAKTDLEILQELQEEILEKLRASDYQPRIADFLRVLDFKTKLKLPVSEKQKFWDLLDQLRREELETKEEDDEN